MISLKVTVIYGNYKHDIIYKYTHFLLDTLNKQIPIQLDEFLLYDNFSIPCKKCGKCLAKNYNVLDTFCINNIAKSISESDLIIFAYSKEFNSLFQPSLKFLMDNLSYMWMPHKNNIPMSQKIGLIISDNNIPFLHSTTKLLKKHFRFWGIKNINTLNLLKVSSQLKEKSVISKNYLTLILLGEKIVTLISSNTSFSSLNLRKIIQFPNSKIKNDKLLHCHKNFENNIVPLRKLSK